MKGEHEWRERIAVASTESKWPFATYDMWNRDELEVRGFLIVSSRVMREWFNMRYDAASREFHSMRRDAVDPDMFDEGYLYDLAVESCGVDPHDYDWQLSSAVIKDACSLYEVYLERAADQVLSVSGFGLKMPEPEGSWSWQTCRAFYEAYFGIDVRPSPIGNIIWMRNKMTHLRDMLRTDEGEREFRRKLAELGISDPAATSEEYSLGLSELTPSWSNGVRLSHLEAYRIINMIRLQVNQTAELMSEFENGNVSSYYLDAIKAGNPAGASGLNPDKLLTRVQRPQSLLE